MSTVTGALDSYRRALKEALNPTIRLIERDAHINDDAFAHTAAELLMESLRVVSEMRAR